MFSTNDWGCSLGTAAQCAWPFHQHPCDSTEHKSYFVGQQSSSNPMASPGTGRATPPAPAVPPSSALLQCLSQLDVDAWASVLLPKLVADGSAGSLAATCSQLRALCQSCVQRLDLQQLASPDNPGHIYKWMQHLGERFTNCTCVDLPLREGSHYEAPFVVSALAR